MKFSINFIKVLFMRKISFSIAIVFICVAVMFNSCSNYSDINENLSEVSKKNDNIFVGIEEYKTSTIPVFEKLSKLSSNYHTTNTRAMQQDNDSIDALVQQLVTNSRMLLQSNGIDVVKEFGSSNNPRIALAGMALLEYDRYKFATRSTLGGCILEAAGVRGLFKASAKQAAKMITKAALKKAIPGIGWGLFFADLADCLLE